MTRKLLVSAASALIFAAMPAAAGAATTQVSFFHGGTSSAGWETFTPAPPGPAETDSIKLQVQASSATDFDDFAGVQLLGLAGPPPATPPSFYWYSNRTGGSGGSPRMSLIFSDGGRADLRPESLTAGGWVLEDGATNDWDNYGGSCGFLYRPSYATILGCHAGATATVQFLVNDSGWAFAPADLNIHVDNIRYGSAFVHERVNSKLVAEPIVARVLPNLSVTIGSIESKLTESDGTPIVGRTVTYTAGSTALCSAVSNAQGVARCTGVSTWLAAILGLGFTATFPGDDTYDPATARGSIAIVLGLQLFG